MLRRKGILHHTHRQLSLSVALGSILMLKHENPSRRNLPFPAPTPHHCHSSDLHFLGCSVWFSVCPTTASQGASSPVQAYSPNCSWTLRPLPGDTGQLHSPHKRHSFCSCSHMNSALLLSKAAQLSFLCQGESVGYRRRGKLGQCLPPHMWCPFKKV